MEWGNIPLRAYALAGLLTLMNLSTRTVVTIEGAQTVYAFPFPLSEPAVAVGSFAGFVLGSIALAFLFTWVWRAGRGGVRRVREVVGATS